MTNLVETMGYSLYPITYDLKIKEMFLSALCVSIATDLLIVFFPISCVSEVEKAIASLNGRFFGGRVLTAEKYDPEMFNANDLSG